MIMNKTYKVVLVGPTGAGKSQFCNFLLNAGNSDLNNNDEENLKVLVEYLRNKKELNQIFLVHFFKNFRECLQCIILKTLLKIYF